MQVKISQAVRMIISAIKARVVPLVKGSPGCGKSQIVHQIAQQFNLELIDIRLAQCDPTDLAGFPTVTKDGKADYLPMQHFPIKGDPLPPGKAGWLMFLDEATSAPTAIQSAAYKLVLDRMVGSHHLHEKCAIVMAGNLETDGAIVFEMSTALQSRIMHMEVAVDNREWLDWASENHINHQICSFVKYKPGLLYTFKPDHTDSTYACPRTWEFANRLLETTDEQDLLPVLSGTLSEGVAREFLLFRKIYENLLTTEQILANPEGVPTPSEPSIMFALTGSIAHNMTDTNAESFMKFVSRLPMEFQVFCLRDAVRRNRALLSIKPIQHWIATNSKNFF